MTMEHRACDDRAMTDDARPLALVTGPTAGIGREFARQLAARGCDLVLVSRDADRLNALADKLANDYGIGCTVLPADLTDRAQLDAVCEWVRDNGPLDWLVNSAGFGVNQKFVGGELDAEQQMLDVLCTAVLRLTHAALPAMVAAGRGHVVVVASVAAWMPAGTYSAAKAWAGTFAESLHSTLAPKGVKVTGVYPGFTHTEFHDRAEMDMSQVPDALWLNAEDVVSKGIRDCEAGRAYSVAGRQYQVIGLGLRHLPRAVVRRIRG